MPSRVTHVEEPIEIAHHSARVVTLSLPRVLSGRYPAENLTGQFVLSRSAEDAPAWPRRQLGSWHLTAHPTLPVYEMVSADGAPLGWLAGFAIDAAGRMVEDRVVVPFARGLTATQFESYLYSLGGRYLAVLITPGAERVYLDPAGCLGAVYSPAHEMVAATTTLIPYTRGCDDDVELIRDAGIPRRNGIYPFGLTPRIGVRRVLPNHYLDLRTWSVVRHWPTDLLGDTVDPDEALRVVGETIRRQVGAVTLTRPAYVGFTAGHDSRMITACSRKFLDRIRFMTLALPDRTAEIDCYITQRLARRCGLDHEVIPFVGPTPAHLNEWLWRTGAMIGEFRGMQASAMYRRLDPLRAELTGHGGELCRTDLWNELRRPPTATVDGVLYVLDSPPTPRLKENAEAWLRSLPAHDPVLVYDLLHLEQWLGCWGGVLPYAEASTSAFRLYPIVHRDAIDRLLRLPPRYKASGRFSRDLITANWPELMSAPFNRYPGMKHYIQRAKRRVWLVRVALARRGIQV